MNTKVAGARAEPDDSITDTVLRYLPELRARARFLTQDTASADDLVQDAIERALTWQHRMWRDSNVRGWLNQVLRNLFITEYRRRAMTARFSVAPSLDPDGAQRAPEPADLLSTADVENALATLAPKDAVVFRMAHLEGLPYREISDRLGMVPGTVATRLHRIRRKLKRSLASVYEARLISLAGSGQ
ncbi:MAG TPA: RNA polymerase sigma factor [Acidobacteriaceae bacterium]|nr:RNA polymerase sigma factor [Acidobacteriaceae bacterium]